MSTTLKLTSKVIILLLLSAILSGRVLAQNCLNAINTIETTGSTSGFTYCKTSASGKTYRSQVVYNAYEWSLVPSSSGRIIGSNTSRTVTVNWSNSGKLRLRRWCDSGVPCDGMINPDLCGVLERFPSNEQNITIIPSGTFTITNTSDNVCVGDNSGSSTVNLGFPAEFIGWEEEISSGVWEPVSSNVTFAYNDLTEPTRYRARAYVNRDHHECGTFSPRIFTISMNVSTPSTGEMFGDRTVFPGRVNGYVEMIGGSPDEIIRWERKTGSGSWISIGLSARSRVIYDRTFSETTLYRAVLENSCGEELFSENVTIEVVEETNEYNWIYSQSLDEGGIAYAESKSYFDDSGDKIQDQTKLFSNNTVNGAEPLVFISEPLKDRFDRVVGQTLSAPANQSEFDFSKDFFNYDYRNFDNGNVNNPDDVPVTNQGTLGWYYSTLNTWEQGVAATNFPYSRQTFYDEGSGEPKQSAGPGDHHHLGSNHEVLSKTRGVGPDELQNYLKVRAAVLSDLQTPNNPSELAKEIVVLLSSDPQGKVSVAWTDKGQKVLVSGLLKTTITGSNRVSQLEAIVNIRDTYFEEQSFNFYDDSERLVASVSPNGVLEVLANMNANGGTPTYNSIDDLPFTTTYEYDFQGRLLAMNEPDAGRTEYLYRRDGKIRFSQNAQQLEEGDIFSYTHYDKSSRPVESGEYIGTINFSKAALNPFLETTADQMSWSDSDVHDWIKTTYDHPQNDMPQSLIDLGYEQDFVMGAVSTTENEYTKTWYSYDELGRVRWMVQFVTGLNKYFTLDYTYDFLGNVLEVAYQKDVPAEAYYHHYEYDADKRLSRAYTSIDGVLANAILQAEYEYYLHGPLKRVEIANGMQGMDYYYTIQGWLKAINNPEQENEGMQSDVFWQVFHYHFNDYQSAEGEFPEIPSDAEPRYDGNIRGVQWGRNEHPLIVNEPAESDLELNTYEDQTVAATQSITLLPGFDTNGGSFSAEVDINAQGDAVYDEGVSAYVYAYDLKNQLTDAAFDDPVGGISITLTNRPYSVEGISYDPNGNIKSLTRRNGQGIASDNFADAYHYKAGKNQLDRVDGYASYQYDDIGQMTRETSLVDGTEKRVEYDVTGKVVAVRDEQDRLRVSFEYDDRGFRLYKKTYNPDGSLNLTTWYIRDASGNLVSMYEKAGTEVQQTELPIYASSRVGVENRAQETTMYEVSDHLGNVRAVFTDGALAYKAGFEAEDAAYEERFFENVGEVRLVDEIFSRTGVASGLLNRSLIGSSHKVQKIIPVKAGDRLTAEAYAQYVSVIPDNLTTLGAIASWLTGQVSSGGIGEGSNLGSNGSLGGSGGSGALIGPDGAEIIGSLNYIFMDHDMQNVLGSGTITTTGEADGDYEQLLLDNIPVAPDDGFAVIYVENDTEANENMFFDDIIITHESDLILVQATDYYPFGMPIPGRDWRNDAFGAQISEAAEITYFYTFEDSDNPKHPHVADGNNRSTIAKNGNYSYADFSNPGPVSTFYEVEAGDRVNISFWAYEDIDPDNGPAQFVYDVHLFTVDGMNRIRDDANIPETHNQWSFVNTPEFVMPSSGTLSLRFYDEDGAPAYMDDLRITISRQGGVQGELNTSNSLAYRYGYQGQFAEKDDETGWNHFELRQYDSRIGRFTTVDPAGQFWSSYIGMSNNPTSSVDPTGGVAADVFQRQSDGSLTQVGIQGGDQMHYILDQQGNLETTILSPVEVVAQGPLVPQNLPDWLIADFNTGGFEMGFGVTVSMGPQTLRDRGLFGYSVGSNITLLKFRPTLKWVYGDANLGFAQSTLGLDMAGGFDGQTNASVFGKAEGISGLFDAKYSRDYILSNGSTTPILGRSSAGVGTIFTEGVLIHNRINGTYELKIGAQEDFAQSFGLFGIKLDANVQGTLNQR
ncbi:MAG: RHS repeat-associated core domain-containing protein [Bacteroidota bacterium]